MDTLKSKAEHIIKIMQDAGLDTDQMLEVLALAKQKLKYYQSKNNTRNENLHRWQSNGNRISSQN